MEAIAAEDSRPRIATLGQLLAAPHLMAWLAYLPDDLPAQKARTRLGVCHLGALSLAGALPEPDRLTALAATFPRFMLLEETPSRLAAEVVQAARAERVGVPLLWRGEDSRLLAALRGAPEGPVALLTEEPESSALVPILACLTGMLGRQVRFFTPTGAAPAQTWPESGPLAVRRDALSYAPVAAFFDPATWARHRPAFVAEHGRPGASRAAREVALRAGIPHLRFADPSAPPAISTAPAMSYRANGFVSAALVLSALHKRTGRPAAGPGIAEEYGRDAGWARMWTELRRLLAT